MMKPFRSLVFVALLLGLIFVSPDRSFAKKHNKFQPAPCSTPVAPIHNTSILVLININYSYNIQGVVGDQRSWHRGDVVAELNNLGRGDGNSFSEPNGVEQNFTFTYTLNNDGQDHFTGSLYMAGWGVGWIHTFSTQYSYADSAAMVKDLTDQAYSFIHGGWHDLRSDCPQY
jgi:hypothetical protein